MKITSPLQLAAFAATARKLLRKPLYDDDVRAWSDLLANLDALTAYFAQIGLQVEVSVSDGYAFLDDQLGAVESAEADETDDAPADEESGALPPLLQRRKLKYGETLLAVILRRRLDTFDRSTALGSKCFVTHRELLLDLQEFFEARNDQPKQLREFGGYVKTLVDLGFLRVSQKNEQDPDRTQYEIRRIIRARLTPEILEEFQRRLAEVSRDQTSAF